MMTPGRPRALRSFLLASTAARKEIPLRILLLVIFGSVGTLARYALQGLVQFHTDSSFPTGTLAVNLTGCFLLGGIGQFALQRVVIPPDWRIAITVGFFGAFTTFSSFSWESVQMIQDGEWTRAILYVGLSVVGGLLLAMVGIRIAERI
jgi:fluoride exporter